MTRTQRFTLIATSLGLRVIGTRRRLGPPWPMRLAQKWPFLLRIPARLIGVGVRPEHVQTPESIAR